MMAKMRLEVVRAAGARSKLNETVPRAIFSDLIKSTNSRLVRSRVLLFMIFVPIDLPSSINFFDRLGYFIVTVTLRVFF